MDKTFAELLTPFIPRFTGELTPDVRLREGGLDSIHSIDLLLALEDQYGIEIPASLLNDATFETAGTLWSAVQQTVAKSSAPPSSAGAGHG